MSETAPLRVSLLEEKITERKHDTTESFGSELLQ